MDVGEVGRDSIDWIDLSQDRGHYISHVNTVMNIPLNDGKFLGSYATGSVSKGLSSMELVTNLIMCLSPHIITFVHSWVHGMLLCRESQSIAEVHANETVRPTT